MEQGSGVLKVVSLIDATTAAKAGLQTNDLTTHVDGEHIVGLTLEQVAEKILGPVNTPITLTIVRKGRDEPFDVKIVRDPKREYRKHSVAVDSFESNPWGLYNVHGNVWDWTEDCWNANNNGNAGNGSIGTTGDCSKRMVRGDTWFNDTQDLRSASRSWITTDVRCIYQGFRLALILTLLRLESKGGVLLKRRHFSQFPEAATCASAGSRRT